MKNPLYYIQKYPHRTKQILGITNDQFQDLLSIAEIHHHHLQAEIEHNKVRVNKKGGGRKPKLEISEEVCLCLFYLRQIPTFEILGLHFGISKTEANDTFYYWLVILRTILPASLLEQVETNDSDYTIALELLKEFQLIVSNSHFEKNQRKFCYLNLEFRLSHAKRLSKAELIRNLVSPMNNLEY